MEHICGWFKPKEDVAVFDNGLRIESEVRILNNDKWQPRYVVCQRRCSSEAPLIGIFKSDAARDRGNHLELFYLQNYIGYEYGFKFKRTKRTLAILVQGQTLIFSFHYLDSMLFWKEWLKDVCGRSAIYFMRAYVIPRNPAIVKLNSRDVRVHITRFALVIVQNIPPSQSLYLRLDDLFDVQCVQNKFIFRALAHTWAHPHEFLFVGDQVGDLNHKLQCLLKPRQFLNPKILKNEVLTPNGVFSNVNTAGNEHLPQFFINHQSSTTSSLVGGRFNLFTPTSSGGHASASRRSSIDTKGKVEKVKVVPISTGAVSTMQEQQKERRSQQFKYDRMLAQEHRRRKSSAARGMRKVYSSGDLKNLKNTNNFPSFNMVINNKFLPYQTNKKSLNKTLDESSPQLKSSTSVNRVINGKLNINGKKNSASNDSSIIKKSINSNNSKSIGENSILSIYNNECKKNNFGIENINSDKIIFKTIKGTKSVSDANIKTYADWLQRRPSGISFLKIVEALRRPVATSSLVHPVLKNDNSTYPTSAEEFYITENIENDVNSEKFYENSLVLVSTLTKQISNHELLKTDGRKDELHINVNEIDKEQINNKFYDRGKINSFYKISDIAMPVFSPRTKHYSKTDNEISGDDTEEGSYAIPELLGIDAKFSVASAISPTLAYFGMAPNENILQFMNQNTINENCNEFNCDDVKRIGLSGPSPPGLIKPVTSSVSLLKNGTSFGKALCHNLQKNISGSFAKYDGDRITHDYPRVKSDHEDDEDDFQTINSKRNNILSNFKNNSIKELKMNQENYEQLDIQQQHSSFDSSTNSSVKIEGLIRKGRERIRLQPKNESINRRKINTPDLIQQNLIANTDCSLLHQEYIDVDLTTRLLVSTETQKKVDIVKNINKNSKVNLIQNLDLTYENNIENFTIGPKDLNNISPVYVSTINNKISNVGNNYCEIDSNFTNIVNPAISTKSIFTKNEVTPNSQTFLNSCISLPVVKNTKLEQDYYNFNNENEYEDIAGMVSLSGSLDSVRSELNPRVVFQRNGRCRISGHSIKSAHRKQRFTEQQQAKDELYEKELRKTKEKQQKELKITNQIEEKHKTIKNDLLTSESIFDAKKELINSSFIPTKSLTNYYINAEPLKCNYQTKKSLTKSSEKIECKNSKTELSKLQHKHSLVHTDHLFNCGDDYADIIEDPRHNTISIKSSINDFVLNNKIRFDNDNIFNHPSVPNFLNDTIIPNAQIQETDYVSICPSSTMALGKLSRDRKRFSVLIKKSNSMNALNHSLDEINEQNLSSINENNRRQSTTVDDPFIYTNYFDETKYPLKEIRNSDEDLNLIMIPSFKNENNFIRKKIKPDQLSLASNYNYNNQKFQPYFTSNQMSHKKTKLKKNKALSFHFLNF